MLLPKFWFLSCSVNTISTVVMFVFRISIDLNCQIEKKNKVLSNKAESHVLYKQSVLTRQTTACARSSLDPILKCIVRANLH